MLILNNNVPNYKVSRSAPLFYSTLSMTVLRLDVKSVLSKSPVIRCGGLVEGVRGVGGWGHSQS